MTIKTSWALSAFHLQLWQGVCWGWAVGCRCLGDGAEMMADDVRVTRDQEPGGETWPPPRSRAALCPGNLSPGAVEGSDFYIQCHTLTQLLTLLWHIFLQMKYIFHARIVGGLHYYSAILCLCNVFTLEIFLRSPMSTEAWRSRTLP